MSHVRCRGTFSSQSHDFVPVASGAELTIQYGVPTSVFLFCIVCVSFAVTPKSDILTSPFELRRMFAALMSEARERRNRERSRAR